MRLPFFLLLACFPLALPAQEAPRVRSFPSEAYQAQRQNWAAAQSDEGWMYFANSAGILEFDGAAWTLLPFPRRQVARSVGCARGRVFCGAYGEFGFWERDDHGQWRYTSLSQPLASEKAHTEEIWHILATEEYVLFQSFSTIFRYDYELVSTLTPPGNIMFIHEMGAQLLFQVIDKGLYELMPGNSFRFVEGSEIFATAKVSAILPLANGEYLVGTISQGLFHYREGRFRPWDKPINERLKKYQINKGIALRGGGLALGTILDGVYALDASGDLRFRLNQENGLQNNTVLSMLEDRDGNLWLGLDKGVDLVEMHSPLRHFADRSGKTGTVYTAALFQGNIYIGTNHGVFYRKWAKPEAPFQLLDGAQGQVWELQVFDGQLLCGHNDGTFLIEGGTARKISSVTGGWKTIRHPARPDMLVQGSYNGIILFKKDAGGRWAFSHRADGFLSPVRDLHFDAAGALWAAHPHRGLHRILLDEKAIRVREIRHFDAGSGLPADFNIRLAKVRDTLLIQADTSFFIFRQETRQLEPIRSLGGLPLPGNARILPGGEDEWFMATERALSWVRGDSSRTLDVQLEPGYENAVNLNGETYLFCLQEGYALLGGADWPRLAPAQNAAPHIRTVKKAGKNNVRFGLACPQYARQPQFRYRLLGYEDEWSPWKAEAVREYMNLPPGNYRFQAQSSFSSAIAERGFAIPPPWYLSKVAGLVYFLFTLLAIWSLDRISRRRVKRERQKLEAEKLRELEKERMEAELRSKNNELANLTMNLLRKNEALAKIKEGLQKQPPAPDLKALLRMVDQHISSDADWALLEESFNNVYGNFFKKLKSEFPDLSPGDLRLTAYLKMNLSSKEIAQLLNLSVRGVENKRYRLRKKLGLAEDANLAEFIIGY